MVDAVKKYRIDRLILKEYPRNEISAELVFVLDKLRDNKNIRKNKTLHLPNNKYNELNLFLLFKKIEHSNRSPSVSADHFRTALKASFKGWSSLLLSSKIFRVFKSQL